jgi:fatty-acyl-CoA synthase
VTAAGYSFASLWQDIARAIPDEIALVHGDRRRSWREFEDRAARLAGALAARGVKPGAAVAIDLYNCSEYLEAYCATLKLRATPLNVNYRYLGAELAYLLNDAGATAMIFHTSLADRVAPARPDLPAVSAWIQVAEAGETPPAGDEDYEALIASHAPAAALPPDPADTLLSYTGGTTGLPKGCKYNVVAMTQVALNTRAMVVGKPVPDDVHPAETARRLAAEGSRAVAIPAAPLMHSTGLQFTSLPTLCAGGTVVTLTSRSFDPRELIAAVEHERVSTVAMVGDAFARPLVRALEEDAAAGKRHDLSSLRMMASAGVAWSAETKQKLFDFAPQVALSDNCGATEGVHYGSHVTRRGDAASTAEFIRSPGLLLVDEDGNILPDRVGQVGLLAHTTAAVAYHNDPAKSAKVFRVIDGKQYAVPGDYGRFEAGGKFTLMGRGSNTVNTGGEKVHPEEVEHAIKALPGIDDCIVVGLPDERFGQRVVAVVQVRAGSGANEAAIVARLKETMAGYKVPRQFTFVPQMPRFPNGKADYAKARELASGSAAA